MQKFIKNYMARHRSNVDRVLHLIGIPLVLFGIFQMFGGGLKAGLLNFFIGYLLQWIGHTYFEKNEVGEWTLIKNIIKKFRGA